MSQSFFASHTYDTTGRLQTVSDGTDTFAYSYETDSNLLATVEGPVHGVAYDYEPDRDLMTTVDNQTPGGSSSVSTYGYTYDALGRRSDRTQSGSAVNTPSTDDFSYNPRSEVIGSSNDTETAAAWNPTFDYDKIGNRLSSTGETSSASSVTYETNALNQYTQVSGLSSQPSHDLDGNLTSDGGNWTYTWNNENRLSSATNGTVTIDFTYDYQGRLVKKDDGTDVEVYVYDGWNRIASFDPQASGLSLQTSYLWGLDLSGSMQGAGGVGGLLKEGDLYPTYDANGNIMQKLDDTGAAVMSVDYDPFGNIIDGQLVGEYGFSTKPLIDDLDWYYYGFRYYDPVTGRWPSRDPLGDWAFFIEYTQDLGETETEKYENEAVTMPYNFVGNNSISHFDIHGLISSVHAAIARAMATGNVAELTALLKCGAGSAAQQAAMRAAIARLNSTAKQIIAKELKAKVMREFPKEMLTKTLAQISKLAKQGNSAAKKAKKLLNDKRFKK